MTPAAMLDEQLELDLEAVRNELTPLEAFIAYRDAAGTNYDPAVAPIPY